jgi:GNAT superfamily N-acetyltransferase
MLTFMPIAQHQAGIIVSLLLESYAELLSTERHYWKNERENWLQFDLEVFHNPDTVGQCVFLTSLKDEMIGFGSFDPRQCPEFGIIGHNCILPRFRGHGYGKLQILEILSRFRLAGIKRAIVSTSEHPFFLPAQRMYLSCGFLEKKRYAGGPDPRYGVIEYEMAL